VYKKDGKMKKTFLGFQRTDGSVGIRNHVLIIPAQGNLRMLAQKICDFVPDTKTTYFPWEIGRSKADRQVMARTFIGLGLNPNVSSVLVIGIEGAGFEELNTEKIRDKISQTGKRVEFLIFKKDENIFSAMEKSVKIVRELVLAASSERRQIFGLESLSIGVKCGYSDTTSGISGNPVVGKVFDEIVSHGGKAFFSEPPEIIGGEHIVTKRARNKDVANKLVTAAKGFEDKALSVGEDIRAINPMPANKEAGISTLEEKTLGAITKSGSSIIEDVLEYAKRPQKGGLYFIDTTPLCELYIGLASAGAQLMLFQVGTNAIALNLKPSGSGGIVMPISYITGNNETYKKQKDNFDFNSGPLFDNIDQIDEYRNGLLDKILDICSGTKTKVETANYQERIELYLQDPVF